MQPDVAADPQSQDITAQSSAALGQEVRQLRKARRLTLAELSKASGISVSHISAIERGAVNSSFGKVSRIAAALNVPVDWFFTHRPGNGPLERAHVVRSQHRRNLNILYGKAPQDSGYFDWLLSSTIGGGFYMGVSEYLPHSERVEDHLYSREGEQHCVVMEGSIELVLEDETITLYAGDSYSFASDILHRTRNVADAPARLIWVTSPVIIPDDVAVQDRDETATKPLRTIESGR